MQCVYGQDGQDSVTQPVTINTNTHIQVNQVSMLDNFYGSFIWN